MDHVENVGIEKIVEIIRKFAKHGEEVVDLEFANFSCNSSHEMVNNFLLSNFYFLFVI